jgi:hypothetical protein
LSFLGQRLCFFFPGRSGDIAVGAPRGRIVWCWSLGTFKEREPRWFWFNQVNFQYGNMEICSHIYIYHIKYGCIYNYIYMDSHSHEK